VNPDGTSPVQFATLIENIPSAVPNPQLTQWAFAYTATPGSKNPSYNLFRGATPQLSGATKLTTNNFEVINTIQYTPDGSKIVFTASLGSNDFGVYSINTNGTGLFRIGDGEEALINGLGDKLVITRLTGGAGEIGTMNLDGTGYSNLTNNPAEDINPQWSKDGAQIFFSSERNGQFDIYRMTPAGASVTNVTTHADDEFGPSPNMTASQVAFTVIDIPTEVIGVYRIEVNNTGRIRIVNVGSVGQTVFWSPTSTSDSPQPIVYSVNARVPKRILDRL
jgi:Tol biopolymer transport system component